MDVKTKPSQATIIRTVVLVLALFNQGLTIAGKSPLPFDDQDVANAISFLVTAASALTAWWKNNSFTAPAIRADKAFKTKQEVMGWKIKK